MNTPTDTTRIHQMYDVHLPQPSAFWQNVKYITFYVEPRSRFMQSVNALRAQDAYPYTMSQRLPNNDFLITVSLPQLQRIITHALGCRASAQ